LINAFITNKAVGESKRTIRRIEIIGLTKTSPDLLKENIPIKVGQIFDLDQVQESERRMRNFRVFQSVESRVVPIGENEIDIQFTLQDRWTLIPILKASSGGGVQHYTFGLLETNLFGKLHEVGAHYELLQGAPSFAVWYRNPTLIKNSRFFQVDLGSNNTIRFLYDRDAEKEGAFLHRKIRLRFFRNEDAGPGLRFRHALILEREWTHDRIFSDEDRHLNRKNNFQSIPESFYIKAQYGPIWGELDFFIDRQSGWETRLFGTAAFAVTGPQENKFDLFFDSRYFKLIGDRMNLALRAQLNSTSAIGYQHFHFAGGLSEVRGYFQNQFRGRSNIILNNEIRYSLIKGKSIIIQPVAFLDASETGGSPLKLVTSIDEIHLGTGIGARVIFPWVQRAVVRFDYALPINSTGGAGVVFGLQQFF